MNEKQFYLFKLCMLKDIGLARLESLLNVFETAENVLKASKPELLSVEHIGEKIADSIILAAKSNTAQKEIELAGKHKIQIFLYNDDDYPEILKNYPDSPPFLYVKGNLLAQDSESISIVGTRKPTHYGKTATEQFASYFAQKKITIVSGLARGVDSIAHKAALNNNSRTIAVLGNGLLINYPPENAHLQAKIPENGALISEFPLMLHPDKCNFPRRNRIIAALGKAALITEAALPSGTLITARLCAEYGKDVFAVPGNVYGELSQGTNYLIKNGAFPALGPAELYEQIFKEQISQRQSPLVNEQKSGQKTENKTEDDVFKLVCEYENGTYIDLIAQKLDIDISEAAAILLKLEMDGLIKQLPGQVYVKRQSSGVKA
ncbi:MAG: DNA-processing protein DprA [Endomicrobium sp.]|nr:DNA-processing protein DprA [Endomicrobium sp.]